MSQLPDSRVAPGAKKPAHDPVCGFLVVIDMKAGRAGAGACVSADAALPVLGREHLIVSAPRDSKAPSEGDVGFSVGVARGVFLGLLVVVLGVGLVKRECHRGHALGASRLSAVFSYRPFVKLVEWFGDTALGAGLLGWHHPRCRLGMVASPASGSVGASARLAPGGWLAKLGVEKVKRLCLPAEGAGLGFHVALSRG